MYCSNCGKELPENTKFCNYCGAQQSQVKQDETIAPQANAMPQASGVASNAKANGNKTAITILVTVVVVLVASLFGRFVIAPMLLSEEEDDEEPTYSNHANDNENDVATNAPVNQPTNAPVNQPTSTIATQAPSAYEKIFQDRYIVENPPAFFAMDTAFFARVTEDGRVWKAEVGYEGDVVKAVCLTLYTPIPSSFDDTAKTELEAVSREYCEALESTKVCTATYNIGNNYYGLTMTFQNLDDPNTLTVLADLFGLSFTGEVDSVQEFEAEILADGFVKK